MSDNPDQQPAQPDSKTIWMERLAFVLAEAKAVSLATWTFIVALVGCVVTWFKTWRSPPEANVPGPDWATVLPAENREKLRAGIGCVVLTLLLIMFFRPGGQSVAPPDRALPGSSLAQSAADASPQTSVPSDNFQANPIIRQDHKSVTAPPATIQSPLNLRTMKVSEVISVLKTHKPALVVAQKDRGYDTAGVEGYRGSAVPVWFFDSEIQKLLGKPDSDYETGEMRKNTLGRLWRYRCANGILAVHLSSYKSDRELDWVSEDDLFSQDSVQVIWVYDDSP